MPAEQSSWRVASWVTPQTEVTVDPIDASVSPESRSKVSDRLEEQMPLFVQEDYPDFIQFVKYYFKSLELKGNPVDVIQNIDEYYNIDKLNDLVESTTASSGISIDSTVIDVGNTRDFPKEGSEKSKTLFWVVYKAGKKLRFSEGGFQIRFHQRITFPEPMDDTTIGVKHLLVSKLLG